MPELKTGKLLIIFSIKMYFYTDIVLSFFARIKSKLPGYLLM